MEVFSIRLTNDGNWFKNVWANHEGVAKKIFILDLLELMWIVIWRRSVMKDLFLMCQRGYQLLPARNAPNQALILHRAVAFGWSRENL